MDVSCFDRLRVRRGGKKAPLQNQEAVGCDRQGCMMMKPAPVPAFEVSQAKFLLQFFVVALNAPAHFGNGNEFTQRDLRMQIRQPIFRWLLLPCGPLDQQPLLRMRFLSPIVTMGRANTGSGKA